MIYSYFAVFVYSLKYNFDFFLKFRFLSEILIGLYILCINNLIKISKDKIPYLQLIFQVKENKGMTKKQRMFVCINKLIF